MRTTIRRGVLVRLLIAGALIGTSLACQPNQPPKGDGLTAENAGASCWGIKQAFPASTDGTYWLLTPELHRPTQFRCDMTTDGGGWVLIGRGRDGWTFHPSGQGTATAIRATPDGAGAFSPAALSPTLIEGLLNGIPLTDLTDGIRVERATNATGTARQDLRLFPAYARWTWALPSGQRLAGARIDGTEHTNGNTWDTALSFWDYPTSSLEGLSGVNELRTFAYVGNSYRSGFGYGSGVDGGSTEATNFLYREPTGFVLPFVRVWVRPRIANGDITYEPIPEAGFPAEADAPPSLKNRPEVAPWGVVGTNHTNEATITPWYTTVNVVKAYGERVFVGGRFTGVQQGPSGAVTAQGSLAAFDLDGNWIDTFRPTIAGRVWDMTMTSDGKLIIGGDFTSVNGEPGTAGLAALDPLTGQVITTWKASVRHTTSTFIVRGLDSRGTWVYAAGRFNRVVGGGANEQTVSGAASLRTTDGAPGAWKPVLSGTAVRVRAAAAGDRVYLAGYFNAVNGDANHGYHAITDATTGAPVPGMGPWQPSVGSVKKYQQAVAESGVEILVGGSEHNFQFYDRNRTTLLDANVMKQPGDAQAIEVFGNVIYLGCHCDQTIFQGTNNWLSPSGFRSVNPMMQVARFDATTRDYDTSWYPSGLRGTQSDGVWSITQDQRGCVWVGGDLVRGATTGNPVNDWLGGFGRFCPTDTTPPTAPTDLGLASSDAGVTISWRASLDESGPVTYDVYRNNRVIATVSGTSYTDATATGLVRYTVRATDQSGNRSASPPVKTTTGPAPELGRPVAFGSTWRYLADGSDQGTAWQAPAFDDSTWPTGPGTFGWGTGTEATVLTGQPLTSYYRTSFDVTDLTPVKVLDLQLKVNAGAVVHVNGIEAGRINMPTGTITATTPAAAYICCAEETRIKQVTVPGTLLQPGANSLAIELHAWHPAAGRALFDLEARLLGSNGDTTPPSAPALTAGPGPTGGVVLTWTTATDNIGVAGYLITRDGQPLASVGPQTTTYTDTAVSAGTTHTYVVSAFDTNANLKASTPKNATAPG